MTLAFLQSKLFVPPLRTLRVTRTHLLNRLNGGIDGKLTLISAPAGFGKTTLLSEWVAGTERKSAWLSLDAGDNDPERFLSYLVNAVASFIGQGLLDVIQSVPLPPAEAVLTALLNELSRSPDPLLLVLDDYHVIDAQEVDRALAFILDHLPPTIHLVIATREDPQLPLARLRVRQQLTELRAADLRFTPSEVAEFLNSMMGLSLSAVDVAALEARTEGWIAGLQLAALSMQGRDDIDGFIRAFTGNHRYIVDYLVEEVLQQQPTPIRDFLLQTSILNRLSGSLCDVVTNQQGSQSRLETLERGNFFIIPLDDRREWYRYHHLFAEVLHAHLIAEQPDRMPLLHRRASDWYAQYGSLSDAIHHALAGAAFEQAAALMEQAWPLMRRSRQETILFGWLTALPEAWIRRRPVLSVAYAHVMLAIGKRDGVEVWLQGAGHALDEMEGEGGSSNPSEIGRVSLDEEVVRRLRAEIAIARAGLALDAGDVSGTATYARQALALASEDDFLTHGSANGFLGLAYWTNGDLEPAYTTFAGGMASLQKSGNLADVINGAITLSTIRVAQGQLRRAMHLYEEVLQRATVQGVAVVRGAADLLVGMSELSLERNQLDVAMEQLLKSKAMGEHLGFPQNRYRWHMAMARLRAATADFEGALDSLNEAEQWYTSDFIPNVRPIPALQTRVWLAQGKFEEAAALMHAQGLSLQDELHYLREYEHITLARVCLLAYQHKREKDTLSDVVTFLQRLLKAAVAGERNGSIIEILIVQALVHQALGDLSEALKPLTKALLLAEPEGYVRIFIDEGSAMAILLQTALKQGIAADYTRLLLSSQGAFPSRHDANSDLIESLSDREQEVLRWLATDLSGPEIASTLVISLSTLRTHTQHIYEKLSVTNRRAAVRRAEELSLL